MTDPYLWTTLVALAFLFVALHYWGEALKRVDRSAEQAERTLDLLALFEEHLDDDTRDRLTDRLETRLRVVR